MGVFFGSALKSIEVNRNNSSPFPFWLMFYLIRFLTRIRQTLKTIKLCIKFLPLCDSSLLFAHSEIQKWDEVYFENYLLKLRSFLHHCKVQFNLSSIEVLQFTGTHFQKACLLCLFILNTFSGAVSLCAFDILDQKEGTPLQQRWLAENLARVTLQCRWIMKTDGG